MAVGIASVDIESGGSKARMEARIPTRDINIADAMCGGEILIKVVNCYTVQAVY